MQVVNDSKDVSQGQVFNHSDADVAAAYADRLDGEDAYTAAEESRLRWKLDLRLVPILWLNITLSAMDKVTTSTAALYGMKTSTNLTGDRYSWVGSAFYVSINSPSFVELGLTDCLVWLSCLVFPSRKSSPETASREDNGDCSTDLGDCLDWDRIREKF